MSLFVPLRGNRCAFGDLHQNRGYDSLRVIRKGGRRDALAINPQTAGRLRAYLERAGHREGMDGPMFRPLKHKGRTNRVRRAMDPDAIDRVVRKHAGTLGLARGYSAHSMRATFITTALENDVVELHLNRRHALKRNPRFKCSNRCT
jgi:integrase/recombinase XerD